MSHNSRLEGRFKVHEEADILRRERGLVQEVIPLGLGLIALLWMWGDSLSRLIGFLVWVGWLFATTCLQMSQLPGRRRYLDRLAQTLPSAGFRFDLSMGQATQIDSGVLTIDEDALRFNGLRVNFELPRGAVSANVPLHSNRITLRIRALPEPVELVFIDRTHRSGDPGPGMEALISWMAQRSPEVTLATEDIVLPSESPPAIIRRDFMLGGILMALVTALLTWREGGLTVTVLGPYIAASAIGAWDLQRRHRKLMKEIDRIPLLPLPKASIADELTDERQTVQA